MLYHLLFPLKEIFSPLNVIQYITFRTSAAFLTALIISFIIGTPIIKKLRSAKIEQIIREDGPQTHKAKSGTPTMGGLMILISLMVSTLLWARLDNRFILIILASTVWLGLLGFFDDYLKLVKKHPKGLAADYKILAQLSFALVLGVYLYFFPVNPEYATKINIPYLKDCFIDLGIFYIFFVIVFIVGTSNAINLTDGLDGLAVGTITVSALSFLLLAYIAGNAKFSHYLRVIPVTGAGEISIFLGAMVGAALGFLWFNTYPAEVFMGDTGSLFLGGTIGITSIFIKQELLFFIIGGIFIIEAFSVILQIGYFKLTKKRIFKMAPIHHHFELLGWKESKVVIRFWIVSIILSLIALSSLKIR
jgi:phospho-N-acetylmuramoyl-pentapeptide-transferase